MTLSVFQSDLTIYQQEPPTVYYGWYITGSGCSFEESHSTHPDFREVLASRIGKALFEAKVALVGLSADEVAGLMHASVLSSDEGHKITVDDYLRMDLSEEMLETLTDIVQETFDEYCG